MIRDDHIAAPEFNQRDGWNVLFAEIRRIENIAEQFTFKSAAYSALETVHECTEMTWALRLKRMFNTDITICNQSGSSVKIIACRGSTGHQKKSGSLEC